MLAEYLVIPAEAGPGFFPGLPRIEPPGPINSGTVYHDAATITGQ